MSMPAPLFVCHARFVYGLFACPICLDTCCSDTFGLRALPSDDKTCTCPKRLLGSGLSAALPQGRSQQLRSRKAALNNGLSMVDARHFRAAFPDGFRVELQRDKHGSYLHSVTWHALHPAESSLNGSTGPSHSSTAHDMGRKQSQQERDKRKLASNLKQQNRSRGRDHRRAGRLSLVRGTQDRELQHTRRF